MRLRSLCALAALAGAAASSAVACASLIGVKDITDDSPDAAGADGAIEANPDAPTEATCTPALDASDPNNCGQCGHSCLGGMCANGVCQPQQLAMQASAHALAVDEANVYFTVSSGSVQQIAVTGGSLVAIATSQPQPGEIGMAGTTIYWTVLSPATEAGAAAAELRSAPVNGNMGMFATLRSTPGQTPAGLTAVGGFAYYGANTATSYSVHRASAMGGDDFGAQPGQAVGLTSAGTFVYFTDTTGGLVLELPVGAAPQTYTGIASGLRSPKAITTGGGRLFWIEPTTSGDAGAPGAIRSLSVADGGAPAPFQGNLANPVGIASDGVSVYWTDANDGAVYSAAVAGGAKATVATGQMVAGAVAVNSKRVFWITRTGQVMVVAK